MGLMRTLGRAGTLALAGAAAGVYLRRKGLLGGGPPALVSPVAAPVAPQAEAVPPVKDAEPETLYGVVEEPHTAAEEPAAVEAEPADAELVAGEADPPIEPEEDTVETDVVEEPLEPGADDVTEPPPAAEERPDVISVVDDLLAAGR